MTWHRLQLQEVLAGRCRTGCLAPATKTSHQRDYFVMTPEKTALMLGVMKGLPSIRAFVLQFRDPDDANGSRSGRIEHVASGQTATFRSLEDLPQVLRGLLENFSSDEESGTS
jgi:hypothetical protein